MFEKIGGFMDDLATPMGKCASSLCKKGCNGASGSAAGTVAKQDSPDDEK